MVGLAPQNLRQLPGEEPANDTSLIVEVEGDGPDVPEIDDSGAILRIDHGDGSVTVSLDGRPLAEAENDRDKGDWFANLAEEIDPLERSRIAEDLLRGIRDDEESRKQWLDTRESFIKMLGIEVEVPGLQGASDGAPVEGMSKVRHPLLLEAVLRFQANARSEMLPTDGPVKVRDDNSFSTTNEDLLADALARDMNHYLTVVATEYYPDTDRMYLRLGLGGTMFKKVYFCPLRMRPVSETVDVKDLIVDNEATDLANAKRVTHRIMLRSSTVKRMQILGVYRDIPLSTPNQVDLNAADRAEKQQQGISPTTTNPEDRDRQIYECYCELDIKGFEHKHKGEPSGLEIPYRVTIDVTSREILSIVRNYDEKESDPLPTARKTFVKYTYVPGFGFYDIGLGHILGNTTNAVTAAWREMLDNGMFANFPGFLIAKVGARQNTNIIRVPPGGGAPVDTGGMPIKDAVMPLPYETAQMPALMNLVDNMAETGQRLGGTAEMPVGEGKQDAPVGTTLALIEQATKIENAVHKRMHASQAEEFQLLKECFKEHPESFWERGTMSDTRWNEQMFLQALENANLVPQADPNTASHIQRLMKAMGVKQLQAASPALYDPIKVDTYVLQSAGITNPEQFFAPPEAQAQPPPELQQAEAKVASEMQDSASRAKEADARALESRANAEKTMAETRQIGLGGGQGRQVDTPVDQAQARAKLMGEETKRAELGLKAREMTLEDQNRDQDRASKERLALLDLAKEIIDHPEEAEVGAHEVWPIEREIGAK